MKGGYKGYYNNMALDSSYEYIYCKILEAQNKIYKVHENVYQLDGRQYTPDFFIYNETGDLIEIVEIRGRRLGLESRVIDVSELKEIVKIPVNLYTEKDIQRMCKEYGLSYNSLKVSWRTNPDTIKNLNKGEFNAMYGKKQSEEQKRKSSEKGKERFKSEPEKYYNLCTSKLIAYNLEHNFEQARKPRSKRVDFICQYCGETIIKTESEAGKRKYCSNKCKSLAMDGLLECRKAIKITKINRDVQIKEIAIKYTEAHAEEMLAIKLNSITTSEVIFNMIELIKEATGVFDMRTIGIAVCGKPSRKEMVLFLKDYILQFKKL